MAFCNNCGTQTSENDAFCDKCGAQIKPNNTRDPASSHIIPTQEINTSGQEGGTVVPQEIRGWNWGAFYFGWIWGIGNQVWMALLSLIPFVGFIMAFVLGVNGNEWAWRKKKWGSIEQFKKTQRTWGYWALGVFIISAILPIIVAVAIPNIANFTNTNSMEQATTELSMVQVGVVAFEADNAGKIPANTDLLMPYFVGPLKGTYYINPNTGTVTQTYFPK